MAGPIQERSVELMNSLCSRNSGLRATCSTFGAADRFRPPSLASTPEGSLYYSHCPVPPAGVDAPSTSLGMGERWERLSPFIHVAPNSYRPVTSYFKHRSSLDGPEFCTVTLKSRPTTSLDRSESASPGPAAYNVARPISGPAWVLGGRLPDLAEVNRLRTASRSGSVCESEAVSQTRLGTSRKGTFGSGPRFPRVLHQPHSPSGAIYYAHNKSAISDTSQTRATSLGRGIKTEFEKLYEKTPGPMAYFAVTSVFKPTSPIDGLRPLARSHVLACPK